MPITWLMSRSPHPIRVKASLAVEQLEDRTVPDVNPLMEWFDLGIVFQASGGAYYPSVIYDSGGFGIAAPYRMWYSDGTNGYVTSSSDGIVWDAATAMTGLNAPAHHIQVLYDATKFGGDHAYKAWFWDTINLYSIEAIKYAQSSDGIHWTVAQTIGQNPAQPLVTGHYPDWNTGSYGPIDIHYQPAAANTGANPWDYRYVMYYDGTDGNREWTGLAYSSDGLYWNAYPTGSPGNPILAGQATYSWDCWQVAYGTIIQQSPISYVYFYSGGGSDQGGQAAYGPLSQGIGLATSADGIVWNKEPGNPIFHISQGVDYRNRRVYTPEVFVGGDSRFRMYYTAVGTDGIKKIGLALGPALPPEPEPPAPPVPVAVPVPLNVQAPPVSAGLLPFTARGFKQFELQPLIWETGATVPWWHIQRTFGVPGVLGQAYADISGIAFHDPLGLGLLEPHYTGYANLRKRR